LREFGQKTEVPKVRYGSDTVAFERDRRTEASGVRIKVLKKAHSRKSRKKHNRKRVKNPSSGTCPDRESGGGTRDRGEEVEKG